MYIQFRRFIGDFLQYRMALSDRVLIYLILLNILTSGILLLVNALHLHYASQALFNMSAKNWSLMWNGLFWKSVPISLLFFFYGIYIRAASPKTSVFLWGIGFLPLCMLTNLLIADAIQTTPFPPIDPLLVKIDQLLSINTPVLMAWTHNHPQIHHLLNTAYQSLILECIAIPLILTSFCARKPLTIFYIAQLSTILVGAMIYYFFPTMAPSSVFHSPFFTSAQHDTALRFFQLHHFLAVTAKDDGGLIAFPSFHVVWAILIANCFRDKNIIFYPLAIWNGMIILATFFLGWHYFADILGGAVLAVAGIGFGEWVYYSCLSGRHII